MSTTTSSYTEVQIGGTRLTKPVTLRVTVHGDDAYDIENFKPCLAQGRYSPYNRWHAAAAVRAFGLDVLDDYLPFAIEDPNTVVYAVVPLAPDEVHILRSIYGSARYSDTAHPPVVAFPVPELPRSKDDLLLFAKAAQDAYHYGLVSEAVVLLGVGTRVAGAPTTLWRIVDLRSHQINLLVALYRLFFKTSGDKPEPHYSTAKSRRPVERKCAPAPFRSPGGYEPFTRWEIVEMVRGFGLDVMDDVLPYVINNDYEVVHAMLPDDKLSVLFYRAHLFDHVYPRSVGSYAGVRVTDYVNTLDEFVEMLTCSSCNLLIVSALSKVVQVNVSASFTAALQHNVLRRTLPCGSAKQV